MYDSHLVETSQLRHWFFYDQLSCLTLNLSLSLPIIPFLKLNLNQLSPLPAVSYMSSSGSAAAIVTALAKNKSSSSIISNTSNNNNNNHKMTTGAAAASASRRTNNTDTTTTSRRTRDGSGDDYQKKMMMYGGGNSGGNNNLSNSSNKLSSKEKEFYTHNNNSSNNNGGNNAQYTMGENTSATVRQRDEDYVNNSSTHSNRSAARWEIGDPRNGDSTFGKIRDWCGWFVNCNAIQTIMTILILSNALLLGILTFENVLENEPLTQGLEALDLAILSAFTAEFLCQLIYLGFSLVQNNWLIFDCIVVSFSWIFLDSSVAVLRSFRIFRIFSLVSKWESLRVLFAAVGKTMPKMASIWLALMIFFYIFCVLCTTLYADLYEDGYLDWDYFGRLDYTFITLFQIMTLDSWTAVVRQVMVARPWSWLAFLAWVIVTSFFVLNLVVAVICESLIEIQKAKDQEKAGALIDENANKQAASAMQMDDLIQQQHHMLNVQQDLIRTQVEMQQTLNMIMFGMNNNNNNNNSGPASPAAGPTTTNRSQNAMLLEQMISQEETSFHNSHDSSSFLHRFHSSNDSILSGTSRRFEEQ